MAQAHPRCSGNDFQKRLENTATAKIDQEFLDGARPIAF